MKVKKIITWLLLTCVICVTAKADIVAKRNVAVVSYPWLITKSITNINQGDTVNIKFSSDKSDWVIISTQYGDGSVRKAVLENKKYLGEFMCTAYAYTGNPCANGNFPVDGYSVACNSLPFETRVWIDGVGNRVVEDRGPNYGDLWIDIYMGDEASCFNWGVRYCDVYEVTDYE